MWRIYSLHNVLFILHRITGVALLIYLATHIWAVSTAMLVGGPFFDALMSTLARPQFLAVDLLLLGAVTFHALNGLRLIVNESGIGLARGDLLARLTIAAALGIWVVAGVVAVAA